MPEALKGIDWHGRILIDATNAHMDPKPDISLAGVTRFNCPGSAAHNSKAVHHAYARKAKVKLPSLESYERQAADGRIIPLPSHSSENRHGHFGQSVG